MNNKRQKGQWLQFQNAGTPFNKSNFKIRSLRSYSDTNARADLEKLQLSARNQ